MVRSFGAPSLPTTRVENAIDNRRCHWTPLPPVRDKPIIPRAAIRLRLRASTAHRYDHDDDGTHLEKNGLRPTSFFR